MLSKTKYLPVPAPETAQWMSCDYIDDKLTLAEYLRTSSASDAYLNWEKRISADNGKTWSELKAMTEFITESDDGGIVRSPGCFKYDATTDTLYETWLYRQWPGNRIYTYHGEGFDKNNLPYNDHTIITENGTAPKLLRFEEGPDYDLDNPFDPEFSRTNVTYFGQSIVLGQDGTVFFSISVSVRQPDGIRLCGVVLMRRDPKTGVWLPSNSECVPLDVSSRGMLETDAALCRNENIMIVSRGSNTDITPGRKWLTFSTDGGKTISPIEEFRYDDGSRFYSPSSIHKFVRSSKNGKLYWVANVVQVPPDGNGPRYPLQIFEIDEENMAVCKDSEVIIDDKTVEDTDLLHISNFNVVENRETLDIEICVTRIGRFAAPRFWEAGVDKYTFTPPA